MTPKEAKELDRRISQMSDRSLLIEIYRHILSDGSKHHTVFMTNEDMERQLGVSRRTLYQWRQERRIPYYKVNRSIVYKCDDVLEFLNRYRVSVHEQSDTN